jgi:hypothetical protein
MKKNRNILFSTSVVLLAIALLISINLNNVRAESAPNPTPGPSGGLVGLNYSKTPLNIKDIQAAADANRANGFLPGVAERYLLNGRNPAPQPQTTPIDETVFPHYFGPYANYANSPLPTGPIGSVVVDVGGSGYSVDANVIIVDAYGTGSGAEASPVIDPISGAITAVNVITPGSGYTAPMAVITDVTGSGASAAALLGTLDLGTGIRKFVDSLPGLGVAGANTIGNYIPIAIPDTTTYPGADYYEIEVGEYTQQLHSDLPLTTLRGYRQVNTTDATVIHSTTLVL